MNKNSIYIITFMDGEQQGEIKVSDKNEADEEMEILKMMGCTHIERTEI